MSDGPTHRYIGASAGCWELYGQYLAGEFDVVGGRFRDGVVDAYAAQHPGEDVPPARQSVAVHLVTLDGLIGHGLDVSRLNGVRVAAARWGHAHGFDWLEPIPRWDVTLLDVVEAPDAAVRGAIVDEYVDHVYRRWMAGFGAVVEAWYRAVSATQHP